MNLSTIKLIIIGVIAVLAVGYIAAYTIEQRKIGADKVIAETRERINEINENANDADARFLACFDAGFVYNNVTNRCTEERLDQ